MSWSFIPIFHSYCSSLSWSFILIKIFCSWSWTFILTNNNFINQAFWWCNFFVIFVCSFSWQKLGLCQGTVKNLFLAVVKLHCQTSENQISHDVWCQGSISVCAPMLGPLALQWYLPNKKAGIKLGAHKAFLFKIIFFCGNFYKNGIFGHMAIIVIQNNPHFLYYKCTYLFNQYANFCFFNCGKKKFIVTINCRRWKKLQNWLCWKPYAMSIFSSFIIFFRITQARGSAKPPEKYTLADSSVPLAIALFNWNFKKKLTRIFAYFKCNLQQYFFLVFCSASLYPKIKIHWWTGIFCIILDPYSRVSIEIIYFPVLNCFAKLHI